MPFACKEGVLITVYNIPYHEAGGVPKVQPFFDIKTRKMKKSKRKTCEIEIKAVLLHANLQLYRGDKQFYSPQ
jgi:hypothetical protein